MINFLKKLIHKQSQIDINGIVIDFDNKSITIPSDFKIYFEGDATISSKKNINICSNYKELDENGQPYSVYINSDED